MARNNHQEAIERTSETARAGVREATDHAENVMQTGIQAAQRVAEEFGRVLGAGGQNENLTRQASQNLEAITETGSVLIRGFQDVSREWLEMMQERLRKNAEGMTKLARCRTLPDFAAVQSDLARDNLLQYLRREPKRILLAGPISLWLRGGYSLERTEGLLESLVIEGILRYATPDELQQASLRTGYVLTDEGFEKLPPEDRSYGAV